MAHPRRVILVRPEYTRGPVTRGSSSPALANTTDPVAHPSTRGVCVGGVFKQPEPHARTSEHAKQELTVVTLLDQLSKLSPSEQKMLLDRAAAQQLLAASDRKADRDISLWAEAVYQAFCAAIGGSGAAGVGPMVARKLLGAASSWQPVEQFMAVAGFEKMTVRERQQVYTLLADLLVSHTRDLARYVGAPFSIKLIASTVVNIAGVFDAAFPGYLEAGLAQVVARRHSQLHRAA